jgi:hypothetical protein
MKLGLRNWGLGVGRTDIPVCPGNDEG